MPNPSRPVADERAPVLAACPICGPRDTGVYSESAITSGIVRCSECNLVMCCNTEAEAIAAWNTRPAALRASPAPVAAASELADRLEALWQRACPGVLSMKGAAMIYDSTDDLMAVAAVAASHRATGELMLTMANEIDAILAALRAGPAPASAAEVGEAIEWAREMAAHYQRMASNPGETSSSVVRRWETEAKHLRLLVAASGRGFEAGWRAGLETAAGLCDERARDNWPGNSSLSSESRAEFSRISVRYRALALAIRAIPLPAPAAEDGK